VIHFQIGEIYINQKQYENAIPPYKEALRLDPDFETAAINLGLAYQGLKQYANAITYFQRVLQKTPKDAKVLYVLGTVYTDAGDLTKASETYRTLLPLDAALAKTLSEKIQAARPTAPQK